MKKIEINIDKKPAYEYDDKDMLKHPFINISLDFNRYVLNDLFGDLVKSINIETSINEDWILIYIEAYDENNILLISTQSFDALNYYKLNNENKEVFYKDDIKIMYSSMYHRKLKFANNCKKLNKLLAFYCFK